MDDNVRVVDLTTVEVGGHTVTEPKRKRGAPLESLDSVERGKTHEDHSEDEEPDVQIHKK